jgi:hypothetical protein
MALTTGGSINNDKAKQVYGTPAAGTRMPRLEQIASEAAEATKGDGSDASIGEAFIDGSTASGWKTTSGGDGDSTTGFGPNAPGYPQAASVPGSPGFPGLTGPDAYTDAPSPGQGKNIKAGKAPTVASSSTSNNPAVSGSPGFPGLP